MTMILRVSVFILSVFVFRAYGSCLTTCLNTVEDQNAEVRCADLSDKKRHEVMDLKMSSMSDRLKTCFRKFYSGKMWRTFRFCLWKHAQLYFKLGWIKPCVRECFRECKRKYKKCHRECRRKYKKKPRWGRKCRKECRRDCKNSPEGCIIIKSDGKIAFLLVEQEYPENQECGTVQKCVADRDLQVVEKTCQDGFNCLNNTCEATAGCTFILPEGGVEISLQVGEYYPDETTCGNRKCESLGIVVPGGGTDCTAFNPAALCLTPPGATFGSCVCLGGAC